MTDKMPSDENREWEFYCCIIQRTVHKSQTVSFQPCNHRAEATSGKRLTKCHLCREPIQTIQEHLKMKPTKKSATILQAIVRRASARKQFVVSLSKSRSASVLSAVARRCMRHVAYLVEREKKSATILQAIVRRASARKQFVVSLSKSRSASVLSAVARRCMRHVAYLVEREQFYSSQARIERSCRSMYRLAKTQGVYWDCGVSCEVLPDLRAFEWLEFLQEDLYKRYEHLERDVIDAKITTYISDEIHRDFPVRYSSRWSRHPNQEDNNPVLKGLREQIRREGMPPCGLNWGNFDPQNEFWKEDFRRTTKEDQDFLYFNQLSSVSNGYKGNAGGAKWMDEGLNRVRKLWVTDWGYDKWGCPKDNAWK